MSELIISGLVNMGDPRGDDFPTGPAIGQKMPDFTLNDQSGNSICFSEARGSQQALLLFYRSASW